MMATTIADLAPLLGEDFGFKFVGEGAANIVFEIIQPNGSHPFLKGKLLRVPKARKISLDYLEVQSYWESTVRPLFEDGDLVDQSLVAIRASKDILARLNAAVTEVEAMRRSDFQGGCVAQTEYGMLVEDMRKKDPGDTVLEFKPKWLSQSPDAPPTAIRCRNCAKEALRRHDKRQNEAAATEETRKPPSLVSPPTSTSSSKSSSPPSHPPPPQALPIPCTIDLLEAPTNPQSRNRVLSVMASSWASSTHNNNNISQGAPSSLPSLPSSARALLSAWLQSNTLLPRLAHAQRANDCGGSGGGCLRVDPSTTNHPKLDLAMTLRDCTCFLRIPALIGDGGGPDGGGGGVEVIQVEAKLADLDKKNGPAKLKTWQALERRLVEEGWYTRPRPREEWTCRLERREESGVY